LVKLGLDNTKSLKIFNSVTENEKSVLFNSADTTIIPSIYESFGLVSIESLVHGAGIVSFSGSGIEEWTHESTSADFSNIGDIEDFINKTELMAKKFFTDNSNRKLAHEYVVKNFKLIDVADQIIRYTLKN